MYVIGISSGIKHGHHDGAAVLLQDGELNVAAEEERFALAKHACGAIELDVADVLLMNCSKRGKPFA